ncbi:hypothetical protein VNI00_003742 [Paramarasmius palmivorus]|uniref:Uncharacterized protein n=1 Tax=Paramarasmius palmivorus TaxID=297713 RepID=A0AAW0DPR7_9AGAR
MNVKRESLADVENRRPKRPRRSCAQRLSYVKRDENNAYYQKDFLDSVDHPDRKKGQETGKEIGDKGAGEKSVSWEPQMQLMSNEALIILSLRVELTRSEETITQLKSELSDLSDKHVLLADMHENQMRDLKHEIARLKQTTLVSASRTAEAQKDRLRKKQKIMQVEVDVNKAEDELVAQVEDAAAAAATQLVVLAQGA